MIVEVELELSKFRELWQGPAERRDEFEVLASVPRGLPEPAWHEFPELLAAAASVSERTPAGWPGPGASRISRELSPGP